MKLSIRGRLMALSLMSAFFVALVGAVGFVALGLMTRTAEAVANSNAALRSQLEADQMHDALRGDVLRAVLAGSKNDAAEVGDVRKDLAEHTKAFNEQIEELRALALSPAISTAINKTQGLMAAYVKAANEVVQLADQDMAAAEGRMPAFGKAFKVLEEDMAQLSEAIHAHAKDTDAAGAAAAGTARMLLVGATVVGVALLMTLSILSAGQITRPLHRAMRHTQTVAAGDLSRHVEGHDRDETGHLLTALQHMGHGLANIVGQVRESAESIATASAQIAGGNMNLSQRTEEQASSLEQTAAAMEELTATVRNNAEVARRATDMAHAAAEVAQRGGSAVDEVIDTMGQISDSSRRISDIIGVIDGIAFQTNILALNAAVEAARAGEQGRGFAVVASEVRSLAQRSATAAREIKTLISSSVERVEAGTVQVGRAGETVRAIVHEVSKVSDLIREISDASSAQSDGIGQIDGAIHILDQTTQQNAALVEESAAAAESLKEQAVRLTSLVTQFKLPQ